MEKRRKKKFLKLLSVRKKVFQALGLLINKVVKFTESFKSAITLVPLTVAILNPTLYQPDRAELRIYIVNLPIRSTYEYPRDVK